MYSLVYKCPRIALSIATLLLLVLIGGANTSAAPPSQTPTPQPPKPILLEVLSWITGTATVGWHNSVTLSPRSSLSL